jgi:hypothetical protein
MHRRPATAVQRTSEVDPSELHPEKELALRLQLSKQEERVEARHLIVVDLPVRPIK